MKKIPHQFQEKDFYNPSWEINHLFLGTFNPLDGQEVNYYYARERNKTWALLSKIINEKFDPTNFSTFHKLLVKHGIACIDMIHSIQAPEERITKILGEGYKDSEIINKSVIREYNTDRVLEIIKSNEDVTIYSTWGKGSTLKEWKNEVAKIKTIIPLVSPSMAAKVPKGERKFEYMLADWKEKVKKIY